MNDHCTGVNGMELTKALLTKMRYPSSRQQYANPPHIREKGIVIAQLSSWNPPYSAENKALSLPLASSVRVVVKNTVPRQAHKP